MSRAQDRLLGECEGYLLRSFRSGKGMKIVRKLNLISVNSMKEIDGVSKPSSEFMPSLNHGF